MTQRIHHNVAAALLMTTALAWNLSVLAVDTIDGGEARTHRGAAASVQRLAGATHPAALSVRPTPAGPEPV